MKSLIRLNKKAQSEGEKFPYIMTLSVLIPFVFILFVTTISNASRTQYYMSPVLERDIITERATSSQNCFAYQDEVGRVYPSIIDISKFSNEVIKNCMVVDEYEYDFEFKLSYVDKKADESFESKVYPNHWNENQFEGSKDYSVLVQLENEKRVPGVLRISYQKSIREYDNEFT